MLEEHYRTTFVPVVAERDGDLLESKYSGSFYLSHGHAHPVCTRCAKPLQPFLQLRLKDLPERPLGWLPSPDYSIHLESGILQVFFCTNIECFSHDGGGAFSASSLVEIRYIEKRRPPGTSDFSDFEFPPKTIVAWQKRTNDVPDWAELESLGVEVSAQVDEEIESRHVFGDKLLGWPGWVQNVDYPHCPACGARMTLLFQLDCDGNLGFDFLAGGTGQVCVCPIHPFATLVWACG